MFKKSQDLKKLMVIFILFGLMIVSFFLSIAKGAVDIGPKEIIKVLLGQEGGTYYQIIWNVRLPRTLVAGLVGIGLSLSGVILQGIMRNPLAGPNIIGVSSGAGLFSLIALVIYPNYYYLAPMAAFIGALAATLFIYGLAWKEGALPSRLILAGVAVSSILGAGTNAIMTFYPDRVSGVLSFMLGGLSASGWKEFYSILPYIVFGSLALILLSNKLNLLLLGDELATGLGLRVELTRFIFIILSSILAGSAVSAAGLLGFVGLMVPHMVRMVIGSDYRYLVPGTILAGASMVILCDTLARLVFAPMEIPVGIIMSALGGPFFLYLLRRKENF